MKNGIENGYFILQLNIKLVGVVADATGTEAFFLEDESCVENGASLFGGDTKVEVRMVLDTE